MFHFGLGDGGGALGGFARGSGLARGGLGDERSYLRDSTVRSTPPREVRASPGVARKQAARENHPSRENHQTRTQRDGLPRKHKNLAATPDGAAPPNSPRGDRTDAMSRLVATVARARPRRVRSPGAARSRPLARIDQPRIEGSTSCSTRRRPEVRRTSSSSFFSSLRRRRARSMREDSHDADGGGDAGGRLRPGLLRPGDGRATNPRRFPFQTSSRGRGSAKGRSRWCTPGPSRASATSCLKQYRRDVRGRDWFSFYADERAMCRRLRRSPRGGAIRRRGGFGPCTSGGGVWRDVGKRTLANVMEDARGGARGCPPRRADARGVGDGIDDRRKGGRRRPPERRED